MAHNHKVIKVNLAKATGAFKCQYISRLAWESPLLETIAHTAIWTGVNISIYQYQYQYINISLELRGKAHF